MKKKLKWTAIVLFIIIVIMQVIPAERSNPEVTGEISAPPEVMTIFRQSCYDCHSNETKWPWYSYVAPVSWFVSGDVSEGRRELNFSEWENFSEERKIKKLKEIKEEVELDKMPLKSYKLIHPSSELSEKDKELIYNWVNASLNSESER